MVALFGLLDLLVRVRIGGFGRGHRLLILGRHRLRLDPSLDDVRRILAESAHLRQSAAGERSPAESHR